MPSTVSSPVSLPIPVSVSVSVSVSAGSVDWQSQRQSVESKGAAVSARRHSWNDRSRTHSRWLERSEEKECSGSGRSVEADSVQPAGSVDRGEVAVVRVVTERTAIRRRRARHTIGDAVELRATLAHYKAAVDEQKDREADQARKSESEQKDEPHHSRQPVWRTRQPPELPELHLFPPSPTTQDSSEAAAAECGSDVPSAAISVLLDDSVADESVGETDSPRRSGSYRAAVPHMTLSFSSQAESLLQPEGSRRYQGTGAAIAAHHADEQQRSAALLTVGSSDETAAIGDHCTAGTPTCCVSGPCFARCVDDVELLAAWRELLDSSDQVPNWSSEDEVAAAESNFQSSVRTLVWRGIPHSIRQRAWLRLLRDKMPSRDMSSYYALMQDRVTRSQQQQAEQQRRRAAGAEDSFDLSSAGSPLWWSFADIEKDVNRTLPTLWLFRSGSDGVDRLRRVLLAYCVHCPMVGYCQGLNFVAGSLLLVCEGDEVAAFSLLTAMVDSRSGYYSKSMAACMVDTQVLSDLCSYFEPELCALLSGHGLSLSNFCSSWLICLFCNTPLNVYDTFRVWDVLHVLGDEVLFRCGLSLLRHAHSRIAAIRSSEELMLLFLQQLGDVQRIEPVMQHMYAEWRAEPLLSHSIAALREYHRYEITAEHSTLPAATLVRLGEKVAFNEDELQRLWQIFIRPDPWLTISTQCIHSLVHFRYSFCAAVFHPDTSAMFKGRGLILPFNLPTEAAAPLTSMQTQPTAVSAEHSRSTESMGGAGERSAAGRRVSAIPPLPRAASDMSNERSAGGLQRSITAFYNPNDCDPGGVRDDEVEQPLTASTAPTTPTSALNDAHHPFALAVSSLPTSSSSRSSRGSPSLLSHLTHVSASSSGGGIRSLASTFVIPTSDDDTDSIFSHANHSKHSRQASQRHFNQPSQPQQPHTQPPHSNTGSRPHKQSRQQQQLSHSTQSDVEADLSAFHAPSTSVPLSSPPLSPSSHSIKLNAAARVIAFAFSATKHNKTQHSDNNRAATRQSTHGRQQHTDSGGSSTRGHSPHRLPSSFSAHRALLSATTALSTSVLPAVLMEHGRLTLQRSTLSSTLTSPTSSPMSAPSALYSATASTLPPMSEPTEMREARQTFNSTTPLASTVRLADTTTAARLVSTHSDTRTYTHEQTAVLSPLLPSSRTRPPSSQSLPPSVSASVGQLSVHNITSAGVPPPTSTTTSIIGAASSVYACSDNVLARLFSMLDGSSRGVVDFDEFCFGVCLFKRYPRSARLRAMFAMCDVVGDGQVSRADFASFVGMFDRLYHGKRASDAELQSFVTAAFEKAAPSQFINCPLFEQIAPLHPAISKFFRLESASD